VRPPKGVAAGGFPVGVAALVVDSCRAVGATAQALAIVPQCHGFLEEVERHRPFGNAILDARFGGFEMQRALVVPHRPWEHDSPKPDEIPSFVVDQDQRRRNAEALRLSEVSAKRAPVLRRVGVAAARKSRIHEPQLPRPEQLGRGDVAEPRGQHAGEIGVGRRARGPDQTPPRPRGLSDRGNSLVIEVGKRPTEVVLDRPHVLVGPSREPSTRKVTIVRTQRKQRRRDPRSLGEKGVSFDDYGRSRARRAARRQQPGDRIEQVVGQLRKRGGDQAHVPSGESCVGAVQDLTLPLAVHQGADRRD
jgi:hypothetical protein